MPERAEAAQVFGRAVKIAQEARERGLARQALDLQDLGQERIAPQVRNAGQLVGPGHDPGDEPERDPSGIECIGAGAHMRQRPGERGAKLPQMQKTPEGRLSGLRAELLLGRADGDGLFARLELDCSGHRLVSRSRVALRLSLFHAINHSQTVTSFPTASLRLRCAIGLVHCFEIVSK